MKKVLRCICLCAVLALTGCGLMKPVESLYALPALPEEYAQLQSSIREVMDQWNAEYAAVSFGSNTATIQLLDLDGDLSQETAAVFLRVPSAEEKPLRVCLFRRGPDDNYHLTYTIQGDGTSINSVVYEDLTGDGVREVVVSWEMSARVNLLSAYQLTSAGAGELMNISYNETYITTDLDRDGCREIMVFQQRSSDADSSRAEYYRFRDSVMTMASSVPLSSTILDVTAVTTASLADGGAAVYVTSATAEGELTDILTLGRSGLRNVTLDWVVGMSQTTYRSYTEVGAADVNSDGVEEIPLPVALPAVEPEQASQYYALVWRQFDSEGKYFNVAATYHAVSSGWYFFMPGDWLGSVTVTHDDSRSTRGERAVIFWYWPDRENTQPLPFMTLYRLTGDNRESRAKLPGRITLRSDSSAIYCASLNRDNWDCGLDEAAIIQRFTLITPEWSSQ